MSVLKSAISQTIDLTEQLPSPSSVEEIQKTAFDEEEFVKATAMRPAADRLIEFLREFLRPGYEEKFASAPSVLIKSICNELTRIQDLVRQALGSLTRPTNPNEKKNPTQKETYRKWGEQLESLFGDLHRSLVPFRLEYQLGQANMPNFQAQFDLQRQEIADLTKQLQDSKREMLEQLSAKQKSVETTALTAENLDELDQAISTHEKSARNWLLVFIAVAILTLGLLLWITVDGHKLFGFGPIFMPLVSTDIPSVISRAISKILVASFTLGLCLITARTYHTHIHNVIVNRQRRIAMLAFHRLYRGIDSTDKDSRHNLVVQAAQAIFVHGSTGFLPKSGNEFMPYAPILAELLKAKT